MIETDSCRCEDCGWEGELREARPLASMRAYEAEKRWERKGTPRPQAVECCPECDGVCYLLEVTLCP